MKNINLLFVIILLTACEMNDSRQIADQRTKDETVVVTLVPDSIEVEKMDSIHKLQPSVNVKEGDVLTSPATIKVNSEGVWFAHEGELGLVTLLNSEGNKIGSAILMAEGDWMHAETAIFSTEIVFEAGNHETGTLLVNNNPGPGDGNEAGVLKEIQIPVKFL